MWPIWLIISGFFLVIEIATVGFFMFWFSIGALVAMVCSLFITNTVIQTIIFLVVSTILLFATRPFVNSVTKQDIHVKTNAYSIEGKVGKVVQKIEPVEGKGQIKINGEVWSARSDNDTPVDIDTEVIVEKIDGVKAIVKPLR